MTGIAEKEDALLPGLPPFNLDTVGDTPEVVIDLGRLQRNIARTAAIAAEHGVALRPHVKTHKLPPIAALQIEAGAVGIQVAKLGEAEVFAGAGIADIFVGYPLVGERKIARLIELLETTSSKISVADDGLEVAISIAPAARLARASRLADLGGLPVPRLFSPEGPVCAQARSREEKRTTTRAACAALAETA